MVVLVINKSAHEAMRRSLADLASDRILHRHTGSDRGPPLMSKAAVGGGARAEQAASRACRRRTGAAQAAAGGASTGSSDAGRCNGSFTQS